MPHWPWAAFGWLAAWIILKQRLDHYKERLDHFKDILAGQPVGSGKDRTATKAQLQKFYVEVGELLDITLPGDISAEDFKKYESSTEQRIKNMASWIGDNMGPAALARFTDRSGMSEVRYRKTLNRTHNLMIMDQTRYRQNLLAMIESSAWDKN